MRFWSKVSLGLLVLVALAAVFAPLIAPDSPYVQHGSGGGPSGEHWMGLDSGNRDILTRLLYGARWSLLIGLGATAIALVVGAVIGAVAATSRRSIDEGIMRVLDVVMAFPGIALAAVLVAVFGGSVLVLVLAIAFLYMPSVARVVRANVLAQYSEDYVAAEKVIGARMPHIIIKHVAINCAAPVLVFCTVMVADAIVFEASLSFIGAGVRPPDPSWGSVIADGRNMVLLGGWWATVFPGLLILLTVLALNILSEGVADAWAAPSARPAPASVSKKDTVEQASLVELPGLAEAARRLAARARPLPTGEPVLSVHELAIGFDGQHDGVDIVDRVSFEVRPGEVLGLVGESGCGKSLTALTIMGLEPRGARIRGRIRFDGKDLLTLSKRERRRLLGHDMAMVYQDALSSLNPAMTIRAQLKQLTRRGGKRTAVELLDMVGLDPARTLSSYPHELSGGQRQRVLIAMALSRNPKLIVADEPTTALDVTVQAQVIELLLRLRAELGFALILVSHDLALVADITDRVVVMYGGQIVETGVTATVVGSPRHHYARGLLGSVLSLEAGAARLTQIRGVVPSPADFPAGCRFADRCPAATAVCLTEAPALTGEAGRHEFACHHPADLAPPFSAAHAAGPFAPAADPVAPAGGGPGSPHDPGSADGGAASPAGAAAPAARGPATPERLDPAPQEGLSPVSSAALVPASPREGAAFRGGRGSSGGAGSADDPGSADGSGSRGGSGSPDGGAASPAGARGALPSGRAGSSYGGGAASGGAASGGAASGGAASGGAASGGAASGGAAAISGAAGLPAGAASAGGGAGSSDGAARASEGGGAASSDGVGAASSGRGAGASDGVGAVSGGDADGAREVTR